MNDYKDDNLWLMQGDCLERMKEIPSGSVDMILCDQSVLSLYESGLSMRQVARELNTNHKLISRALARLQVSTREPKYLRGVKKFNCSIERQYNNISKHLRFDVSHKWLMQFSDVEKVKFLNSSITNRDNRWSESTEWYITFVEKFYPDTQFNTVYDKWVNSGRKPYMKPSVDHINPKAKGGTNAVENLQFLSWFENRCKNDMSQEDWDCVKRNISEYFVD